MRDRENSAATTSRCVPWKKGKLIGAKPPLRPKRVWSIRTKLQFEGRLRDLAMLNLAIDSKLRGCDLVALKSRGRCTQRIPRGADGSATPPGPSAHRRARRRKCPAPARPHGR